MHALTEPSDYLRIVLFVGLALMIVMPMRVSALPSSNQTPYDLEGVRIALWTGAGALQSSVIALDCMFSWMNATVVHTNQSHVLQGGLDGFDIVVFPGGTTSSYSQSLGTTGRQIIRDFVSHGGSYFGICGGSLFATRYRLDLFNGSCFGPVAGSGSYMMNMSVNRESTGPDLSEEPETYEILYWGSVYFSSSNMTGIIPIVTYSNGNPAMIAFHFDSGTVFLSSPHPEYEENDARDGTTDFDYLDDSDSEWGFLLKVSRWLVDASPEPSTTQTSTQTSTGTTTNNAGMGIPVEQMVIGLLGVIGIVAVITVVILKHR